MSISLVPDLQIMTCVQVAVPILNSPEIRRLIECFSPDSPLVDNIEVSDMIKKVAMEKIRRLVLTHPIEKMVKNCIMHMFSQIIDCKKAYAMILTNPTTYVNQYFEFFFELEGTLDRKKTAVTLVENPNLHLKERFELACTFFLVDDALNLWNQMASAGKSFTPLELECRKEVKLWTEVLEEGYQCNEISQKMLTSKVLLGNVYMVRYVFEKLPYHRQRLFLLDTASEDKITPDVMKFCLSHLSIEDQHAVFENFPVKVLQSISTWSNQFVFTSVANRLWPHLSNKDFYEVIRFILHKIINQASQDFTLMHLLKELWLESPFRFKEHLKREIIFQPLKMALTCDTETFPLEEFFYVYRMVDSVLPQVAQGLLKPNFSKSIDDTDVDSLKFSLPHQHKEF